MLTRDEGKKDLDSVEGVDRDKEGSRGMGNWNGKLGVIVIAIVLPKIVIDYEIGYMLYVIMLAHLIISRGAK